MQIAITALWWNIPAYNFITHNIDNQPDRGMLFEAGGVRSLDREALDGLDKSFATILQKIPRDTTPDIPGAPWTTPPDTPIDMSMGWGLAY